MIACGWTAYNKYAGRDFKLLVGAALLELLIAGQSLPSLDIIIVETNHGEGRGFCALVYAASLFPPPSL